MTAQQNNLYFVALLPPSPVYEEAQEYRLYFKENYNSEHALKSPPHITLLSPFRLEKEKYDQLESVLDGISQSITPFTVRLRNFSTFPPGVIYIDVESDEELINLQQKLEQTARKKSDLFNYNYHRRDYHPHLTLAFKDLSKDNFHKAWQEFKDKKYRADFKAESLTLLKHDGQCWQVENEFNFTTKK